MPSSTSAPPGSAPRPPRECEAVSTIIQPGSLPPSLVTPSIELGDGTVGDILGVVWCMTVMVGPREPKCIVVGVSENTFYSDDVIMVEYVGRERGDGGGREERARGKERERTPCVW